MSLRLRQIALVARDLAAVEPILSGALGAEVAFRDVGVAKYGLHNALWALGGTFLEVVSPFQPNTAGGRYLDRRKGDGGYMYIVDCDDLEARREHFQTHNIRIVEDIKRQDGGLTAEALHLHPRDTGATLLSVDRHGPDSQMLGSYMWAGQDWLSKARRDVVIAGATMQCDEPGDTARHWADLLKRPVMSNADGSFELAMDNAFARFVPLADDRGEGLSGVMLAAKDPAGVLASAKTAGARIGADAFDAVGVRFTVRAA